MRYLEGFITALVVVTAVALGFVMKCHCPAGKCPDCPKVQPHKPTGDLKK